MNKCIDCGKDTGSFIFDYCEDCLNGNVEIIEPVVEVYKSFINGQKKQSLEQFRELTEEQKKELIDTITGAYSGNELIQYLLLNLK